MHKYYIYVSFFIYIVLFIVFAMKKVDNLIILKNLVLQFN